MATCTFPAAYSATEPAVVEALGMVLDLGPPMLEVVLRSPVPLQAGLRHLKHRYCGYCAWVSLWLLS
jgi:hypothetical protein